jgi:predicted SAM-dependent methyltransferase
MMKLHLGCGWRNFGPDWVHIDAGDYTHLDHDSVTDLSHIENNTVSLIYSSHMLEYLDRDEAHMVLQEWRRVLRPGGTLRLAVPDFESMVKLYSEGTIKLSNMLGPLYGKMPMSDTTIYHKTVYDYESIASLLEGVGFTDVRRYDWRETEHAEFDDHSQAYIPHMDKDNGTPISLNVECTK